MNQRVLDVIVAGDLFIDLIMSGFPEWPAPGAESFAKELRKDVGGGAAITSCGLARLGSRAAVLSVVGYDSARWVSERLGQFGVDTSELRCDAREPTAISVAVSTPQDRTFLTYPGANRSFPGILEKALESGVLRRARHVHLGWPPPLEDARELLTKIRREGCSISLDTGWHKGWLADAGAMALLPLVDVFFPNDVEARRMTGVDDPEGCLRRFKDAGAGIVALKRGSKGAVSLWGGEIMEVLPFAVTPVDTIGAGDSFNAGFLHYWLRDEAPLTCLHAANFCGAASTEGYGGVAAFPELSRVQEAIRQSLCEK